MLLITACLLLIPLLALLGGHLPPVYPALGLFSWALTGSSMLMVVLTGAFLFAARRHVSAEHVDLHKVGELRSGIVTAWTSSLFMTMFAFAGLSLGVSAAPLRTDARAVSWPAVWTLMLLLAMPLALTTVALVTGRRFLGLPARRRKP